MTEPSPPVNTGYPEPPTGRPTGPDHPAPWFAVAMSVLLVLAGVTVALGAYLADAQPETVVRAYFAALQRGDAAAALGYGNPPSAARDLLTPTVLAAQNAVGPIEDVVVRHVRRTGDVARVDVGYTVALRTGPVRVTDTVPVVRSGHGWRLVRPAVLTTIYPADGSELASYAGAAVPNGPHWLFPGAVPVTYSTPNLVLARDSRVVRLADSGYLAVAAVVSPAGRRAIGAAVTAALRACLGNRSATEALCPVPDPAAVPGSLRGRVRGVAAVRLTVRSGDGLVGIRADVPVVATYQELDRNNIASPRAARTARVSAFCYVTRPGTVWWDVG